MTFNALVVDDNPDILDNVKERLESMGHTCVLARSQAEAKTLLANNRYAYVLLDLAIPVKSGRPSHATNGEDLLWTIRRTKGFEDIPIIIMVSQEQNSFRFAAKVIRNGGTNNMVLKPFSEHGRALGKAVRDALRYAGSSQHTIKPTHDHEPPRPFERGELAFYPSRVELCGVKVCGSKGRRMIRLILDAIHGTDAIGRRRSFCGDELAALVGAEGGPQAVAGTIRNFRMHVKRIMLAEANVIIDPNVDVIINDRLHGYRFSDKIVVVKGQELSVAARDKGRKSGKIEDLPNWILFELRKTGRIRKKQIIQRTGHSDSTVRRSLDRLREDGQIVFEGSPRSGYWRLV